MRILVLSLFLVAPAALAAPRIDSLVVKPNPAAFSGSKGPEVEISVSVKRGQFDRGGCDAAIDLGDGTRPRTLEFGVASVRTLKHTYGKGGNFRISVKGAGSTPCEGTRDLALNVAGAPAKKAEPAKKPEPKKKAEPKKKKAEPKKKPEPKKKKPEPKKKGAEAPSS